MLEREDLEDLWEVMPGIKPCKIYQRNANSQLGTAIDVGASEKRPIDLKSISFMGVNDSEIEFCTFHLWVSTFSTPAQVSKHWLIEESSGKQWVVMLARLEMQETRYRCDCIEYIR